MTSVPKLFLAHGWCSFCFLSGSNQSFPIWMFCFFFVEWSCSPHSLAMSTIFSFTFIQNRLHEYELTHVSRTTFGNLSSLSRCIDCEKQNLLILLPMPMKWYWIPRLYLMSCSVFKQLAVNTISPLFCYFNKISNEFSHLFIFHTANSHKIVKLKNQVQIKSLDYMYSRLNIILESLGNRSFLCLTYPPFQKEKRERKKALQLNWWRSSGCFNTACSGLSGLFHSMVLPWKQPMIRIDVIVVVHRLFAAL